MYSRTLYVRLVGGFYLFVFSMAILSRRRFLPTTVETGHEAVINNYCFCVTYALVLIFCFPPRPVDICYARMFCFNLSFVLFTLNREKRCVEQHNFNSFRHFINFLRCVTNCFHNSKAFF